MSSIGIGGGGRDILLPLLVVRWAQSSGQPKIVSYCSQFPLLLHPSTMLSSTSMPSDSACAKLIFCCQTKNENIELVLEDLTGEIKVIVNKSKTHLFELAKNLSFDEVIGAVGVNSTRVVFANNIILPDVPQKEIKKAQDETYALFLSDTHIGSKNFLKEKFERFLKWINGESGNEQQQEIAKKTKYLFIVGDLVDGVGIYPSQENDLNITDVEKQYEECARLFSQIPKHIKIIISGGNHDALRLAEPQPAFCNYFIKSLITKKVIERGVLCHNCGIYRSDKHR